MYLTFGCEHNDSLVLLLCLFIIEFGFAFEIVPFSKPFGLERSWIILDLTIAWRIFRYLITIAFNLFLSLVAFAFVAGNLSPTRGAFVSLRTILACTFR